MSAAVCAEPRQAVKVVLLPAAFCLSCDGFADMKRQHRHDARQLRHIESCEQLHLTTESCPRREAAERAA